MTSKTIENHGKVGGDYFKLIYSRRSKLTLDFYSDKFNPDDYWIYKSTGRFREVTYNDLLEFKYSGYSLFKKEIYNKELIDTWIEFMNRTTRFYYLAKLFPPFKPEKIIIKK
jgi:hypothetical protein